MSAGQKNAVVRSRRVHAAAVGTMLAVLLGVATGCGARTEEPDTRQARANKPGAERQASEPGPKVATVGDTVVASAIDHARGLTFEVQSSVTFGDTSLYVTLADHAPAETRDLVRTRPLAATCEIPDRNVSEFAGLWDERFDQFGTALIFDATTRPAAHLVTSCELWVGWSGAEPDAASFPETPFSTVRFG
jgi:hypothetical protein